MDNSEFLALCRVIIWTINYFNIFHGDRKDRYHKFDTDNFVEAANELRQGGLMNRCQIKGLESTDSFIRQFGLNIPTRCGYQFVRSEKGEGQPDEVKVHQFFLMLGLGVALKVCHFWNHFFLASLFQHF